MWCTRVALKLGRVSGSSAVRVGKDGRTCSGAPTWGPTYTQGHSSSVKLVSAARQPNALDLRRSFGGRTNGRVAWTPDCTCIPPRRSTREFGAGGRFPDKTICMACASWQQALRTFTRGGDFDNFSFFSLFPLSIFFFFLHLLCAIWLRSMNKTVMCVAVWLVVFCIPLYLSHLLNSASVETMKPKKEGCWVDWGGRGKGRRACHRHGTQRYTQRQDIQGARGRWNRCIQLC